MPRSLGINSDLDYVTYHHRLDRCGRYDKHGYLVTKKILFVKMNFSFLFL